MMGQPGPPGQAPQQGYPPLGSQPGSPATQGNMTAPSPSMSHRQPPGGQQHQDPRHSAELNKDLGQINPATLAALKQEVGLADKDYPSLTLEEKVRTAENHRMRGT